MHGFDEEIRPQRNIDMVLVISNLALVLFTAGLLWVAAARYGERIEAISLRESRFLTTEWHLLQELKAQSDRLLLEKDREIADLRRRYLRLLHDDASAPELRQIEVRLQQARDERERILSRRLDAAVDGDAAEADAEREVWLKELIPAKSLSENQSVSNRILRERVGALESQLEESRLHIEMLTEEISELEEERRVLAAEYGSALAERRSRLEELLETKARSRATVEAARDELIRKAEVLGGLEYARIEDISTRALVRALASTPVIRSEYPDLLSSMDRYFRVYGFRERLAGRREAYAAAAEALERIAGEGELP